MRTKRKEYSTPSRHSCSFYSCTTDRIIITVICLSSSISESSIPASTFLIHRFPHRGEGLPFLPKRTNPITISTGCLRLICITCTCTRARVHDACTYRKVRPQPSKMLEARCQNPEIVLINSVCEAAKKRFLQPRDVQIRSRRR